MRLNCFSRQSVFVVTESSDLPTHSTKSESVSPYLTGQSGPAPPATSMAASSVTRPLATIASASSAQGCLPEKEAEV